MAKAVWVLSAALYVGVVVWGAFVLPAEGVVSHVGPGGVVDDRGSRAEFVGVNVGLAVLMLVVTPLLTAAATRAPASMLNLPNKDYWLAPVRAEATLTAMRRQLWVFLAATNLVMAAAMLDLVSLTLHGREAVGSAALVVYLVGVTVWTVVVLLRYRRPKDA